jgi:ABC-2 type transport system ATP-binding protein
LTTAIDVQELSKTYGTIQALKKISFQIPHGTVGILGPNGSGKSTFMKILMGILRYNSGQILVEGEHRSAIKIRECFGYMPENDCQFPRLTGLLAVTYAGELAGIPYWNAIKRADQILSYVGLGEAYHRYVAEYSTGMKQRVKLAQALIHDPPYLLLDEPTNGMDPRGRTFMLNLIKDLKRHQKTILLSSHLLKDIEETCDYVIVLHRGELLLQGSISALKQEHEFYTIVKLRQEDPLEQWLALIQSHHFKPEVKGNREIWFDSPPPSSLLLQTAKTGNVEIRKIQKKAKTLEEIFMGALKAHQSSSSTPTTKKEELFPISGSLTEDKTS